MAKQSYRAELAKLADALRDPLRLRLLVAAVTIAVLYFAIQQPVEARSRVLQRESADLQARELIAEDVTNLDIQLKDYDGRLTVGGSGEATRFLVDMVRETSLILERIDGQNAAKLGALEGIRVRLAVSGTIESLHGFLAKLEAHQKLVRVESLLLTPADRGRDFPSMQLVVIALGERT